MAEQTLILASLARLDPASDDHWTAEGLPAVRAVEVFADDRSITREDIELAAPDFTRANPIIPSSDSAPVSARAAEQPEAEAESDTGLDAAEDVPRAFLVGDVLLVVGVPEGTVETLSDLFDDVVAEGARFSEAEYERRQMLLGELLKSGKDELHRLAAEQTHYYPSRGAEDAQVAWQESQARYYEAQQRVLEARAEKILAAKDADLPAAIKKILTKGAPVDEARKNAKRKPPPGLRVR